jgi:hypothetical protein
MGRPSNFVKRIVAKVLSENLPVDSDFPESRVCPFTADWYENVKLRCDDCNGRVCAYFQELGLNDDGEPLPSSQRPFCEAEVRKGGECRKKVVPGKRRCRFHGGLSTGPKTLEGKKRIAEAQKKRWALYRASQARRVK